MDQNQIVDNDLQKAIDDITQTTNVDPVFSDPVAAPSSVPEGDTGELGEPVGPFPEPKIELTPEFAPVAPAVEPAPIAPVPEVPAVETPAEEAPAANLGGEFGIRQIKEAALHDLVPLLDRLNMNASQKFGLYRNIFEDLKDYTVLEPAYRAATEIADDTERAEALLYLVESIDKM